MGKHNTPTQRQKARQTIAEYNRKVRPFITLCGAQCRGQPGKFCQRIPVKGRERCELHGGKTPRGKEWHRQQRPDGSRKSDEWRAVNKLKTIEIRRKELAARLAAMTEEEREAYERYSRAARPGTLAEREDRKRNRRLKKEWANGAGDPPPLSTEAQEIQNQIDRLEAFFRSLPQTGAPTQPEPGAMTATIFD